MPKKKERAIRRYKIEYWDNRQCEVIEEFIKAYSAEDALTIAEHRTSKISDRYVYSINCAPS